MAIYRSDQATVTFGAEASPRAYPENSTIAGSTIALGASAARTLAGGGTVIGATTLTLSGAADNSALGGNGRFFIQVGDDNVSNHAGQAFGPKEVRKVVDGYSTATMTLDHPLAFPHGAGAACVAIQIADGSATDVTKGTMDYYTNWLPGVYEAVDVPDPEQTFESYFIVGGQNRNPYAIYPGQEALGGSIGGMVLLDATPLRFALGSMSTQPSDVTDTNWKVGLTATTGAWVKGQTLLPIFGTSGAALSANQLLAVGLANDTAITTFTSDGSVVTEVIKITAAVSAANVGVLKLSAPLRFDHPANSALRTVDSGATYFHQIREEVSLDSITMDVNVMDSNETGANTWIRRYLGGKVGSMTISAEEGGLVNVGWDSMAFLDMMHNQKSHPTIPANTHMPRYGPIINVPPTSVRHPGGAKGPYYFSHGEVRMFGDQAWDSTPTGIVLARLRSFSITVANGEEPRYYISNQVEQKRGPTEILEGRREYSMTATIATNDSETSHADTISVFKELLLSGDYRGSTDATANAGFSIHLKFTRGTSDTIELIIPGEKPTDTIGSTVRAAGGQQGAFIRSATHNIGDTNPLEAEVDILFRSLVIRVQDSTPVYP